MKKAFTLASLFLLVCISIAFSQPSSPPPKIQDAISPPSTVRANPATETPTFEVRGTIQEWEQIIEILDQSNAPHTEVTGSKNWIADQVNKQITAYQQKLIEEEKAKQSVKDTNKKPGTNSNKPESPPSK